MRRGISLLEVLVAIGVMAIGLLALLALLPLGHYKMAQAIRYDRASTLAQNAMVDVQIRGDALNPLFWLDANGNSALNPADNGQTFNPALTPPLQPPFVIDPLAISHPANAAAAPGYFPVSSAGLPGPPPTIHRLTLRTSTTGPAMPYPLAESIFASDDDVVFDIPDNPDFRTTLAGWTVGADGDWGVAGTDDNGDGVVDDPGEAGWPGSDDGSPRNSAGDYSYLLMVALLDDSLQSTTGSLPGLGWPGWWWPGPDKRWGVAGVDDNGDGVVDDQYERGWPGSDDVPGSASPLDKTNIAANRRLRLSVVVFNKRRLAPLTASTPYSEPPAERMVLTDVGNGVGGGDFTLRAPAGASASDAAHLLKVRPDDWLMLSAWVDDPQFGPRPVCQWYRVAGVDEGPRFLASGEYVRDVILDGKDWSTLHRDADSAGGQTAYATLLVGCCDVHEEFVGVKEGDPIPGPLITLPPHTHDPPHFQPH